MNKIASSIYVGLLAFHFQAQTFLPLQMDSLPHHFEVFSSTALEFSSTSIQNEFSKKMLVGGFLDDALIERNLAKHHAQNRVGFLATSELEFRNYNFKIGKNKEFGFYIRGGYQAFGSAAYSNDLFQLIFRGNNSFKNDTAFFSGTQGNAISMQKIGLGLINVSNKSNFGLNFYNIDNFANGFVYTGQVITDADASNIVLKAKGNTENTQGKKFNKGWGVGFDGDFRFTTNWFKESKAFFQLQLKNIGYMNIRNVKEYRIDSSYAYSGFQISQLTDENSSGFSKTTEVLDTLGIVSREKTIHRFLPGFFQLGKIIDMQSSKKLQSFFGVRVYTTLSFVPQVYVGGQYSPNKWMDVGIQGSYGGFSNFRLGFYTQYKIKNYHFGIGSEDLIGALSKKGYGESIHFKISRLW